MDDVLPDGFSTLLQGAIDLHVHGQPDLAAALRNRGDDAAVARLAHGYGLRGWVLKSHLWATTDRARLLNRALTDLDLVVYPSITLNPPVGGLEPAVVELAAAHGARMVFLPTWGAAADIERDGYIAMLLRRVSPSFDDYARRHAITLLSPDGSLAGRTREVIDTCRAADVCLATGHASLAESRAVASYCAGTGQRLLVTHPLHYVADPKQLTELTDLGAYVEFAIGPLLHPDSHLTIRDVHRALGTVGSQRVVLTTDAFSRWAPPQPECLRMFVEQLSYLGWDDASLRTMIVDNPRQLLGVDVS